MFFWRACSKEGSTRAEKDEDFYKPQGYIWCTQDLKDKQIINYRGKNLIPLDMSITQNDTCRLDSRKEDVSMIGIFEYLRNKLLMQTLNSKLS